MEQLKKEGESGRKTINQYTRYLTVLLATVQGYGLVDRDDPISARLERTLDEKIGNSKWIKLNQEIHDSA